MLIIGHRGAKGLAPENTLAALEAGLAARASMLEIDVRVSSDGTPVLCHDEFIVTQEGKRLFVHKTPFTELQLAKQDLLTLEAALQFVDRRADVNIEIKPGVAIEPVVSCIEPRINGKWLESDLIISSYDFKILTYIQGAFPNIPIAVLEKWSGVRATYRARKLGTKRINMNQRWLWSGFVRSMTKRGYKLSAYTLNNISKARRFEKQGLYGCITDYPDRF
jgi:glycerophosphoryl diester phosphodiesterase